MAWVRGRPVPIARATLAVLTYLDGSADLGELLEDAAAALGADAGDADGVNADLRRLVSLGVLVGFGAAVDGSRVDAGAVTPASVVAADSDPAGEVVEVNVQGDQQTITTRLPDGRMRRTTRIEVSSSSSLDQLDDLLGAVALTDVIDQAGCAAQRLRAGSIAEDLLLDLGVRRTRVRTDHPQVAELLAARFQDRLVDRCSLQRITRSPGADTAHELRRGIGVSAYVIAPFEGTGPPRVYDRWGTRAARPRDPGAAAQVVAALLADEEPVAGNDMVAVHAFAVEGPRGCVLLASHLSEWPQLRRRLEQRGLGPSLTRRVVLRPDGFVEIGGAWPSTPRSVRPVAGCVVIDDDDRHDPVAVFAASLLRDVTPPSAFAAHRALEILNAALGGRRAVRRSHVGTGELTDLVDAIASGRS